MTEESADYPGSILVGHQIARIDIDGQRCRVSERNIDDAPSRRPDRRVVGMGGALEKAPVVTGELA